MFAVKHWFTATVVVIICCSAVTSSIEPSSWFGTSTTSSAVDGSSVVVTTFSDLGNCTCNLVHGQCDAQCCCDAECNGISFSNCYNSSAVTAPFLACVSGTVFGGFDSDAYRSLYGYLPEVTTSDSNDFLSSQLCVSYSNNPSQGLFYPIATTFASGSVYSDTQDVSSSDFSQEWVYRTSSSFDPPASSFSLPPTYSVGSGIFASENGSNVEFLLPSGSSQGGAECERRTAVPFFTDMPVDSSCLRVIDTTSSCSSLSIATIIDRFPSTPSATTPISATFSSDSIHINNIGQATTGVPLVSSLVGNSCNSALLSVEYFIFHSSDAITRVDIKVVTADISMGQLPVAVRQRYRVNFLSSSISSPSDIETMSGSPGYQVGLSVRAANVTGNDITVRNGGLSLLPADASGIVLWKYKRIFQILTRLIRQMLKNERQRSKRPASCFWRKCTIWMPNRNGCAVLTPCLLDKCHKQSNVGLPSAVRLVDREVGKCRFKLPG
mmetsp:Transcript_3161/g.6121  ORF Transcript_3161/g.6121 Transcript_3161/m.6121 type:complete len:495 (-) Transcript_3161:1242-2726(-)